MDIVQVKIDDLKPYKRNPRINDHAVEFVKNSIKEFGFKVPLVIDEDNELITGHTRLKAAIELGIRELPCIVAADLTPAQIKAFRLADNKVAEKATWDKGLLDGELAELLTLDWAMGDFGFDFDFLEDDDKFDHGQDQDPLEDEDKENARMNTVRQYNLQNVDHDRLHGYYQIPALRAVDHKPSHLLGFNYMLNTDDPGAGIHFYVDDYQFERIWQRPEVYIDRLRYFDCALTPDFSLYLDMPIAMKIWNIYRSRLIGQMCQDSGIVVIPTVSWAEPDTFKFCFDGLPANATLSVSTIGVKLSDDAMTIWREGMDEMIKRLQPKRLIVYGGRVPYKYPEGMEVIYIENTVTERMKETKKHSVKKSE